MTLNQIPTRFNTPAKKRLAIGVATVVTVGTLFGVGITGAAAATPSPAGPSTTSTSSTHSDSTHSGQAFGSRSIVHQVREAFFADEIDGVKAQELATAATGQAMVFSRLPTTLQADLTSLKNASVVDRDAAAQKISTTSLGGGYGPGFTTVATDLKSGVKLPLGEIISDALSDLAKGKTLGQSDLSTAPTSHLGAGTHQSDTSGADVTAGN